MSVKAFYVLPTVSFIQKFVINNLCYCQFGYLHCRHFLCRWLHGHILWLHFNCRHGQHHQGHHCYRSFSHFYEQPFVFISVYIFISSLFITVGSVVITTIVVTIYALEATYFNGYIPILGQWNTFILMHEALQKCSKNSIANKTLVAIIATYWT